MKNAFLALLACGTLGAFAVPADANAAAPKDAARTASQPAKSQSNVSRTKGYYYYTPSCGNFAYYDYYGNLYYYYACY